MNITFRILLISTGFILGLKTVSAQQEFTLYYMPVLAQSTYLNPAAVPEHKFSFSLPVPSIYVGFNNSALSVSSFVDKNGNVDYQDFVDGLKRNNNYLGVGSNVEALSFRFKVDNNFFQFSSRVITDLRMRYPKDLLGLGAEGIKDGYSLSGIGIDMNSYLEYGIGFTRVKPDSKWTYGGRLKLLNGLANVQTKTSNIELQVNQDDIFQYDLKSEIELNMGVGVDGAKIGDFDELFEADFEDVAKARKFNKGLAIDGGVTLQFTDRLSFGAAINNLGYINWKNLSENYRSEMSLSFEGATLENIDFSQSIDSLFDAQMDSIFTSYEETFENSFDTTNIAYKDWLPSTLFLSAHYQLSPKVKASGSIYTEFYKGINLGLIAGVNYSLVRGLDLTTTWWWFRKSAANLGIGLVGKLGPVQIYTVMDNILPGGWVKISDQETQMEGVLLPYRVKNFNFRFGMNLVFGRLKEESRLPNQGLSKGRHGVRKYLYKPSLR